MTNNLTTTACSFSFLFLLLLFLPHSCSFSFIPPLYCYCYHYYCLIDSEFQRTARRDKKAFLRDPCKEIEENNRIGKTREPFKEIRDTKGTFHAKMGSIKDRNGMDLTEAEIKNRWQEYTEVLYKEDLHDPDDHNGVITHLEPDILECEVERALGSITMNKPSGDDGIPVELFQILKDDAVKVLHSMCQQIWKTQPWPQDCKRSVFNTIPKKGNPSECSNYCTIALISHTSKVMLKFSKPGFSNTWTENFQMFKLVLKRQGNQRSNCQYLMDHQKSKRVPEKHLFLLYWLCKSLWLHGSSQTVENSERDGNTRPPDLPLEKSLCRSGSNS